ncbi:MAG: zinc carboxypeptidase [Saprospirales bacterium]|nr:zinc carboxypeptidase [Saprospirales bacterium]MBK8923225.1 zinc carboxypeptidase [Saprospirales bacterium]
MTGIRPVLSLAFCCLTSLLFAQKAVKSPDEFLPHRIGEQFTPHHMLTGYFEYLAAVAPATMRLERYGATNEARPLQLAIFSAPENMARLEQIRRNNLRMAGLDASAAQNGPDQAEPVAIVWLSMSVHGNEPSGSECSLLLAYQLATQTEPDVQAWLKNTVVILDPSLNPDGYDRYTHWYRGASNMEKNPRADAREHSEPWPGGRTNHYYFDLNRDWAWATQVETQQRIAVYQRWLPHVHADLHEQYVDNPYYFAPAAEPTHDYITPWQRDFQTQIGQNHARYFDQNGWLYFTREVFDLFYPSYGDTYPMFNGAIGMTYEQAGNARAGRAIIISTGDTLTLHDRIRHHLTTSRSTIEAASKKAREVVANFRSYYERSTRQPQGPYHTFVIAARNDPNKINTLCRLLDRHQIRYGRAGAAAGGIKAYDYRQGKEAAVELDEKDLVISAFQPHSVLVQVLFEPEHHLSDSLTYDITAWALPYAYGLEAYALKQRLEPKQPFHLFKAPEVRLAASPYAWCVHRRSLAEARFLTQLLERGVKLRYAMKPFDLADQQFEPGALVITRADNHQLSGELDDFVLAAAAASNVPLHPIFSGWAGKGRDLGSENFVPLRKPEVALVYGDDVDDNSFGHTWFFLEQELGCPVTPVALERLHRLHWNDYTVLIFPNGNYNLPDNVLKACQDWVRQGGRIVAFEGGVKAFADKEGFDLKSKQELKKDSAAAAPKPYQARERESISDQVPGAIVQAQVDATHPLSFGIPREYFSLKTTASLFEIPSNAATAIWLGDNFRTLGFIGSRIKPKLKNTPIAAVQKMGGGEVVYFVDNPLFRSFWEQGKVLFANALFF